MICIKKLIKMAIHEIGSYHNKWMPSVLTRWGKEVASPASRDSRTGEIGGSCAMRGGGLRHDLSTSRIIASKHAHLLLLPWTKPHCLLEGAAMVARWHGRGACHPADRRRRDASSPQPSLHCNSSTNCVIWEQQTTCWRYSGTATSSHTTSNDAGAALGGRGRWIVQGRHWRRTASSGGFAIWGLPCSLPLKSQCPPL